jgi:hypothetical protein
MVLRRSGIQYGGVVEFDPRKVQDAFKIQARDVLGRFTSANQAVLRANQRSLKYVQQKALENLDQAIEEHGRPQEYNSGRLRRAIENPEFSTAGQDGFDFLIDARVEPQVPYYRAIEFGSSHFVGRRILLNFLDPGGGAHPRSTRDTDLMVDQSNPRKKGRFTDPVLGVRNPRRKDAIIGPRQRRELGDKGLEDTAVGVVIRNPIPAYHYGTRAAEQFRTAEIYKRYVTQELNKLGLKVK